MSRAVRRGAAAALLVGAIAAPAMAHEATYSTAVVIYGIEPVSPEASIIDGRIESPRPSCIARRKVKILVNYPDAPSQLFDVAVTSDEGAWLGYGPSAMLEGANSATVKAVKRRKGNGNHKHVCGSGALSVGRQA